MAKSVQVAVRIDQETLDEIELVATRLARTALPGLAPTKTAVLRAAIIRGLASIQAELDQKPS